MDMQCEYELQLMLPFIGAIITTVVGKGTEA